MKKIFAFSLAALMVAACYLPEDGIITASDDAGNPDSGLVKKHCGTYDAMYQVSFTKISGDCPEVYGTPSVWVNADGTIAFPSNCKDESHYDPCTTYVDENCKTWVYDEWMTGQLNWFPGGNFAEGNLTFTSYVLENGAFFCSSVYDTQYKLIWQAAH